MIDPAEIRAYAKQCANVLTEQAIDFGSHEHARLFFQEVVGPLLAGMVAQAEHLEKISSSEAIEYTKMWVNQRLDRLLVQIQAHEAANAVQ